MIRELYEHANNRFIEIEHADLIFSTKKGGYHALSEINLHIRKGEFVSLVGHSDCAKSTLLNLIGGLVKTCNGRLACANRTITGPSPERSIVHQDPALIAHLSSYENVYLAVERVFGAVESRVQLRQRTMDALALVGLSVAAHQTPEELPIALRQRIGIARALSVEPKVLLLDEPFGALCALARTQLQDILLNIVAQTGATVVMATHDIDEAVLMSDRIVMLTDGPSITIGATLPVLLARPRTRSLITQDAQFAGYRATVEDFLAKWQTQEALKHAA